MNNKDLKCVCSETNCPKVQVEFLCYDLCSWSKHRDPVQS